MYSIVKRKWSAGIERQVKGTDRKGKKKSRKIQERNKNNCVKTADYNISGSSVKTFLKKILY